ncbi:hypothetical protein D3C81_615800 [compost metagenome]
MKPSSVIEQLDVLEDGRPCCFSTGKGAAIVDFELQIGEETLNHCVVVGHAGATHAQRYLGFRRFCTVLEAPVLTALIENRGQSRVSRSLTSAFSVGSLFLV